VFSLRSAFSFFLGVIFFFFILFSDLLLSFSYLDTSNLPTLHCCLPAFFVTRPFLSFLSFFAHCPRSGPHGYRGRSARRLDHRTHGGPAHSVVYRAGFRLFGFVLPTGFSIFSQRLQPRAWRFYGATLRFLEKKATAFAPIYLTIYRHILCRHFSLSFFSLYFLPFFSWFFFLFSFLTTTRAPALSVCFFFRTLSTDFHDDFRLFFLGFTFLLRTTPAGVWMVFFLLAPHLLHFGLLDIYLTACFCHISSSSLRLFACQRSWSRACCQYPQSPSIRNSPPTMGVYMSTDSRPLDTLARIPSFCPPGPLFFTRSTTSIKHTGSAPTLTLMTLRPRLATSRTQLQVARSH